jgi:hypothetical protein
MYESVQSIHSACKQHCRELACFFSLVEASLSTHTLPDPSCMLIPVWYSASIYLLPLISFDLFILSELFKDPFFPEYLLHFGLGLLDLLQLVTVSDAKEVPNIGCHYDSKSMKQPSKVLLQPK